MLLHLFTTRCTPSGCDVYRTNNRAVSHSVRSAMCLLSSAARTSINIALLTECETLWLFGSYKHCTLNRVPF